MPFCLENPMDRARDLIGKVSRDAQEYFPILFGSNSLTPEMK